MIKIPELVKEAIREGTYRKNCRIDVMKVDDDSVVDFTIDNETLVAESLLFDERMNSGKTLKFGLCEGTNVEFKYFDHPNISGRSVWIYLDCEYEDANHNLDWYSVPMGRYTIDTCSRQATTGIIKAVGYNKLLSDYLDQSANDEIEAIIEKGEDVAGKISMYKLLDTLLEGFSIETRKPIPLEYPDPVFVDAEKVGQITIYRQPSQPYYDGQIPSSFEEAMSIRKDTFKIELPEGFGYSAFTLDVATFLKEHIENFNAYLTYNYFMLPVKGTSGNIPFYDYCVNNKLYPMRIYFADENGKELWTSESFQSVVEILPKSTKYSYRNIVVPQFIEHESQYARYLMIDVIFPSDGNSDAIGTKYSKDSMYSFRVKTCVRDSLSMTYREISRAEAYEITLEEWQEITDSVTIRDMQSAVYETSCQYGKIDRITDLFSGVDLGMGGLHPSVGLYPHIGLYPSGSPERATKALYEKLWADEGNIHSFKDLIITYKYQKPDGSTEEKKLTRTVNTHGTDNYNMSDNWLFKVLPWDSESVAVYADAMVEKMKPIRWFPFEMWSVGLPHIETGDQIEIVVNGKTYTSYVLQRNLKGIQHLSDTFINGSLNIF